MRCVCAVDAIRAGYMSALAPELKVIAAAAPRDIEGAMTDLTGLHFIRRPLSGGRVRWHVYAWRGGPTIMTADQVLKPALTPEAVAAYQRAHEDKTKPKPRGDMFPALADAYLASPEYRAREESTKRDYKRYI